MADYDLAIIGGGINGAGLARDAAGRGLRVILAEQHDLASGTSSASTKLIHGGLRYLEHGAFRLVREALREREVLLRSAPHAIRPMRFVLPVEAGLRSWLTLRLGLLVYDLLGGRRMLPGTHILDLGESVLGAPLKRAFRTGFEYSDCQVDDSRLVVLNALDAAERGALICTRTRLVRASRGAAWELAFNVRGRRETASARVLVNAAGPWVGQIAETVLREPRPACMRLVKGSHIVVPRRFEHDRAYVFQVPDRRIVFALPFEDEYTLIGTTDRDFRGDPAIVAPEAEEITYLCHAASYYLREPIEPAEIVWTFAGVRSLYDDGSAKPEDVTRDYQLELDAPSGEAPLLMIYGGKLTTYRRLAEAALKALSRFLPRSVPWTADAPLPGGDFQVADLDAEVDRVRAQWPFLRQAHARRLFRAYGMRVDGVLGSARSYDDLGTQWGADLTAAEVQYLMQHEWAETADDVLWRRSKLGLRLAANEQRSLAAFMASSRARRAAE